MSGWFLVAKETLQDTCGCSDAGGFTPHRPDAVEQDHGSQKRLQTNGMRGEDGRGNLVGVGGLIPHRSLLMLPLWNPSVVGPDGFTLEVRPLYCGLLANGDPVPSFLPSLATKDLTLDFHPPTRLLQAPIYSHHAALVCDVASRKGCLGFCPGLQSGPWFEGNCPPATVLTLLWLSVGTRLFPA